MRAAIFNGGGRPITIEDVPDGPLDPGHVRIEVARCGICGSDISMTSGSAFDYPTGCRLGHETAGEVIEVARDVTRLKVGDKVAVLPQGFCGQCESCRAGRPIFCHTGRTQFGGFGERLVITERSGFRIPESVSIAEAALVEPISCGRHAFRIANLQKGDSVLVLGAGSMGLAAVYWARQLGAGRIVVATRTPARHEIALAMGADEAVIVSNEDPESLNRSFERPLQFVVEAIGKPGVLQRAALQIGVGGTIISLGMCTSADPILPAFNAFQDLRMCFPVGYSAEDFEQTIRAFDAGSIEPGVMVTETVELDRLPELIEEMRGDNNHLKVQIVP